jgi:hypothetical protein
MPDGDIVSGFATSPGIADLLFESFEVDQIQIRHAENQVNLHWRTLSTKAIWASVLPHGPEMQRTLQFFTLLRRATAPHLESRGLLLLQQSDELQVSGASGECGLRGAVRLYLFNNNPIHEYILNRKEAVERGKESASNYAFTIFVLTLFLSGENFSGEMATRSRQLDQYRQLLGQGNVEVTISPDLRVLLDSRQSRIFDPKRGERRPYGFGWY